MDDMPNLELANDWDVVVSFLPPQWREQAKALGALRRCRNIPNAEVLLRVLLIHLADGCSLRETVTVAQAGELATLSDVALMKRLIAAGEWLRWLGAELMHRWVREAPEQVYGAARRVLVVDGSTITEPGPTGSVWRLHYAIDLATLRAAAVHVTDCHVAESLQHFAVQPGDLLLADRGYGRASDVRYAVAHQADMVVRVYHRNVRLATPAGGRFALLRRLRGLRGTQLGDWPVVLLGEDGWSRPMRLCAVKLSAAAAAEARGRVRRKGQKGGYVPSAQAAEAAGYITVLTTLSRQRATPTQVLELYRGRWQIELVFKRLKSILELGHLHKVSAPSITAWLHGKLLVALLVEAMISAGETLFPWGYPLPAPAAAQPLPLAGGKPHAAPAPPGR